MATANGERSLMSRAPGVGRDSAKVAPTAIDKIDVQFDSRKKGARTKGFEKGMAECEHYLATKELPEDWDTAPAAAAATAAATPLKETPAKSTPASSGSATVSPKHVTPKASAERKHARDEDDESTPVPSTKQSKKSHHGVRHGPPPRGSMAWKD